MKLFAGGFNTKSRTENVVRNINVALICQAINTVLGFVSRSFFIKLLGETYLGVNGIFSNILTILNFAELGIGTAIVFNLYKPLKEHDEETVGTLVNFYRKAYFTIAGIIFAVGLLLTPFLRWLISDQPDIKEDISVLYILYLLSTVITYLNAHKKSLLNADQKQHIINIYRQITHTIQIIIQIVFLFLTHNYIVFLLVQIGCSAIENIVIAKEVDHLYPFLKDYKKSKLPANLLSSIKKDVGALTLYKLNSAVIHGTDNILITALEENGVKAVGLYSNYTLISETLNTILGIITNALTPSIGNLNAETDSEKKESIFYTILYLCSWIYGLACSGIMALSNRFISVWIGENYILARSVVFAIALQLYIRSVHYPAYTYRVTCGLFVQSKYVPLLTSFFNIILSILMGKQWGLFGILFATSISRVLTVGISDPYLVYKYVLNKNVISYYLRYLEYALLVIVAYVLGNSICGFIKLNGWIGFLISGFIYVIVYNALFCGCTFKTKEFKYLIHNLHRIVHRIFR